MRRCVAPHQAKRNWHRQLLEYVEERGIEPLDHSKQVLGQLNATLLGFKHDKPPDHPHDLHDHLRQSLRSGLAAKPSADLKKVLCRDKRKFIIVIFSITEPKIHG